MLNLPERNHQDQREIVRAVKRWLATHQQWLLIFDNADQLELVSEFLPPDGKGHVIFTTQAQATGTIAEQIDINKMDREEGTLFLLRRMKLLKGDASLEIVSESIRITAQVVVETLDGLPLALDQAGAYIEETGCSLTDYLELYQTHRDRLLHRRGRDPVGHLEAVAMTWSLSFERVKQANLAAAELLQTCAFFHPDSISETMLIAGASELGSVLRPVAEDKMNLNEAIRELLAYSLIRRDSERKALSIHRLVQTVFRDGMDKEVQKEWARRVVRTLWRAFPEIIEFTTWSTCQQYFPHALVAVSLIDQWEFWFPEAVQLLDHVGEYLTRRGLYRQVEPLLQLMLTIQQQVLGDEHSDTVSTLNNLAFLYVQLGKYRQTEPLLQRALASYEQALGADHPQVGTVLDILGWCYIYEGKYAQAEALLRRALAIWEPLQGLGYIEAATTPDVLGLLYMYWGRYAEAESFFQQALAIDEHIRGPEHLDTLIVLVNLAGLHIRQGKFAEAELLLLRRVLPITERELGPEHHITALSLFTQGQLYALQSKFDEAEPLYQRALAAYEQVLGPEHPDTAYILLYLAQLYQSRRWDEQAESIYKRALTIYEHIVELENPFMAEMLYHLASLYENQGKYAQAQPLYQRALTIREQALGTSHSETFAAREASARLLNLLQETQES
jgi:tetratricopeptide (TPR) repeat protein